MFHFSVTNVWTADDRKNGRNVGKPIRAPSPISQTLNNNAVKAYRGTPQNPGGGSPSVFTFIQTLRIWQIFCVKSECDIRYYISRLNHLTIFLQLFHHERSRRGFPSSTSIVNSGPDGKYTPLHNDASNAQQRLLKNGRNSTAREMFLTLDEKMNVSQIEIILHAKLT